MTPDGDPTYIATFTGTSSATPAAAGVGGLLVQAWADDDSGFNPWGISREGDTVFAN